MLALPSAEKAEHQPGVGQAGVVNSVTRLLDWSSCTMRCEGGLVWKGSKEAILLPRVSQLNARRGLCSLWLLGQKRQADQESAGAIMRDPHPRQAKVLTPLLQVKTKNR